jgi:hypothetical protein
MLEINCIDCSAVVGDYKECAHCGESLCENCGEDNDAGETVCMACAEQE